MRAVVLTSDSLLLDVLRLGLLALCDDAFHVVRHVVARARRGSFR